MRVGNFTFNVRSAGPVEGELVILLHGFPQSSLEWRSQLAALAEAGYRAVAFDQRGYSPGARPEGVEHYRMPPLVADVLAVADDMGGHQFHLVGHDFGAAVAWQVAGRYPERVKTLTAVSVPHPHALTAAMRAADGDQAERSSYMQRYRDASGTVEAELLADDAAELRAMLQGLPADVADDYVRPMKEPGALAAALNWYRAVTREDVLAIGPVTPPTLYVWSDQDFALGRQGADACADYVEGSYQFEVLEGVGHWIPETAADRFNRLFLDHLGRH